MDAKYEINVIADYFICKAYDNGAYMTQKKLHKILFFAYAWYLYLNNDENNICNVLFENSFQGWVHGPVLRNLYSRFADCGFNPLPIPNFDSKLISKEDIDFLDAVYNAYIDLNADDLENLSHQTKSWIESRKNLSEHEVGKEILRNETIFKDIKALAQ